MTGRPEHNTLGPASALLCGGLLLQQRLRQCIAPLLRADGFDVVLSRTIDTTVAQLDSGDQAGGLLTVQGVYHDLKARIDCANAAHANFLVAIHFDAAESSVRGAETIYDTARPFRPDNQRLAQLVQQDVVLSLSASGWAVPDRGILDDSALVAPALSAAGTAYGRLMELGPPQAGYLDRASLMPGALLEGFVHHEPRGSRRRHKRWWAKRHCDRSAARTARLRRLRVTIGPSPLARAKTWSLQA